MLGVASGVASFFKVRDGPEIDNTVFKLHYRATTGLLFLFCLLISANSLIGDPIDCIRDPNDKLSTSVVNTFCWIHTTFTIPKHLDKKYGLGTGRVAPGVGHYKEGDEKIQHAYYQWVPFVLFLQGILFYVPHWLWKASEGNRIRSIVEGFSSPIMDSATRKEKIDQLATYFAATLHSHNFYAIKFAIFEVLNLLNVILNMWFVNIFLGGHFFSYGTEVLSISESNPMYRTDPMIEIFPRVTKCNFHMYGSSGTIERHDMLCVLALNILNEKIYIILWFWFILLTVVTSLAILYRTIVFFIPWVRIALIQKRAKSAHKANMSAIATYLNVGDYFLLYMLGKNMELLSYSELLEELSVKLKEKAAGMISAPDLEMLSNGKIPPMSYPELNLNHHG